VIVPKSPAECAVAFPEGGKAPGAEGWGGGVATFSAVAEKSTQGSVGLAACADRSCVYPTRSALEKRFYG
jgi:hypothetical protein